MVLNFAFMAQVIFVFTCILGEDEDHLCHESVQKLGAPNLPEQRRGESDPEVQRPLGTARWLRGRCLQGVGDADGEEDT